MLRVTGSVLNVEHNEGEFTNGQGQAVAYRNAWVEVDGERVKFRVRADGSMPAPIPSEGDDVVIGVAVNLRENPGNLLHPFSLSLTAVACEVLRTAAEVDEARAAASLASVPSQGGRGRRAAAGA